MATDPPRDSLTSVLAVKRAMDSGPSVPSRVDRPEAAHSLFRSRTEGGPMIRHLIAALGRDPAATPPSPRKPR